MHDIHHLFTINAPATGVFDAITTPKGLNSWWTVDAAGSPILGSNYRFFFSKDYDWRAKVIKVDPPHLIHWQMQLADDDWLPTKLIFELEEVNGMTTVRFQHQSWASVNDHFRRTSYCWAMYFQTMKAQVEQQQLA
jgi:uncharacterized protein YndB with AHSA1/START domain